MLKSAWLWDIAGRDSSTTGQVYLDWGNNGTGYLFVGWNGYGGVHEIEGTPSSITAITENLAGTSMVNYYRIYNQGTRIYLSANGTSPRTVAGATMMLFKFPGYSQESIYNILADTTWTRIGGRSATNLGTVTSINGAATYNGKIIMAYTGDEMSFVDFTSYNNYKVLSSAVLDSSNESLILSSSASATGNLGISKDGKAYTNVYAGGLITIE